jgi:transaldolase/glucose-6-phosphate isomerase
MDKTKTANALKEVLKLGQSIWYDGLVSGAEFERMIREDGLRGATTNPTIFEKALNSGSYDAQIHSLGREGKSDEEVYKTLALAAVRDVADVFGSVYRQTRGQDGFVSIEVSPLLAHDTDGTILEAQLYARVDRKNVMIKIPATAEGIPAIEEVISKGIPVNITLIFAVERYREVMEAYLSGLERRVNAGLPVNETPSVASFFVSRVDSAVDKRLEQMIGGASERSVQELYRSLLGKTAIANSKKAYAAFEEIFAGERFRSLKKKGAQLQRPLWASTGTKNPNYSDVLYVETLIGPNTVNTMPPATLDAFRDHGRVELSLTEGLENALKLLEKLAFTGVALTEVTAELEKSGVELFAQAYQKLIQRIMDKRK